MGKIERKKGKRGQVRKDLERKRSLESLQADEDADPLGHFDSDQ